MAVDGLPDHPLQPVGWRGCRILGASYGALSARVEVSRGMQDREGRGYTSEATVAQKGEEQIVRDRRWLT